MPKQPPKKTESKQDYLSRCTAELVSKENKSREEAYATCNSYWDDHKKVRASVSLSAPVEMVGEDPELILKAGETPKGFLITAYTGQPFERYWGKIYFDIKGMQSKPKIPILREHSRTNVVGHGKAYSDGKNYYVSGSFAGTADGKEVMELAKEGFPWQASIGVSPQKVLVLENEKQTHEVNGETIKGPAEIWTKSQVKEVSFVALGRDDNTAAIAMSEDEETKVKVTINRLDHTEGMDMTLEQLKAEHPDLYKELYELGAASQEVDQEAIRQEGFKAGVEAERARVLDVLGADGDAEVTLAAIKDGTEASEVYKMFFEAEKAKRVSGLEELANQAPESMGQREPKAPKGEDTRSPDEVLAEKAEELMGQDENLSFEAAAEQVLASDQKLAERYRATLMPVQ